MAVYREKNWQEKGRIFGYIQGLSVTKRIEMAIQSSLHCGSQENVVQELAERIGSGPAVAETVPVAIGILIANQGKHNGEYL